MTSRHHSISSFLRQAVADFRPAPLPSEALEARFIAQYREDGLQPVLFVVVLGLLASVITYAVYGFARFDGFGWFEGAQRLRVYRIALLVLLLLVIGRYWRLWRAHWVPLGFAVLIIAYGVGILSVTSRYYLGNTPNLATSWRLVTSHVLCIFLTLPFLKLPLRWMLAVAIPASIAVVTIAFHGNLIHGLLAASAVAISIMSGAAISYNNYRRERQLFDQSLALEESAQRQRQFVRSVTHDIRQPMAAIGIQLSILDRESAGNARTAQSLAPLLTAMSALQSQVDDIAREAFPPAPGCIVASLERTAIDRLVLSSIELYTPLARQHDLTVRAFIGRRAASIPTLTHRGDLTTILQSLISNALKFRKPIALGGQTDGVVVGLTRVGDNLCVRVVDNGIGIARADCSRIFDDGYSTDTGGSGQGLGLGNVKRLIARLPGHRLHVHSVLHRYSSFTLKLPIAPADPPRRPSIAKPARQPAWVNPALASTADAADPAADPCPELIDRRVLVVEDSPLLRESLVSLLERAGAIVTDCDDAVSARRIIRHEEAAFDLVICDYSLGNGPDGIAVLRDVRHYYDGQVATILLSGELEAMTGDLSEFIVLAKPFNPRVLLTLATAQTWACSPDPALVTADVDVHQVRAAQNR